MAPFVTLPKEMPIRFVVVVVVFWMVLDWMMMDEAPEMENSPLFVIDSVDPSIRSVLATTRGSANEVPWKFRMVMSAEAILSTNWVVLETPPVEATVTGSDPE
jgi:hypothetical protein